MPTAPFMRGLLTTVLAATQIVPAAELPVTQVTLYKHGFALFEREGTVPRGEEVRLDFQNNDMNDLLKSLLVSDSAGHVKGVHYDANETLDQRLVQVANGGVAASRPAAAEAVESATVYR